MHLYLCAVVDVSAQGSCTVTPLYPSTLTATGGAIANGTKSVMIQCNCTDNDGVVLNQIGWFNPEENRIFDQNQNNSTVGTPYSQTAFGATIATLVIPTFSDSYDGTYTCGVGTTYPPGPPNAIVYLTIDGELMIITVTYL